MAHRPYPCTIRPSNFEFGSIRRRYGDQDILKLANVRKLQQEKQTVIINDSGQEESIRSIS
jgi:hypothetical protein